MAAKKMRRQNKARLAYGRQIGNYNGPRHLRPGEQRELPRRTKALETAARDKMK